MKGVRCCGNNLEYKLDDIDEQEDEDELYMQMQEDEDDETEGFGEYIDADELDGV